MKSGILIITEERERQTSQEGYLSEMDNQWVDGELAQAAAAYALANGGNYHIWPDNWDLRAYKPSPENRIKELAKAGALIAAEIDRLNRRFGSN